MAGKETKKLDNLVQRTGRKLLTISSVFPLQLFPDTINIDENKIDIIHRQFFLTNQTEPILIKDILTVTSTRSLIFGTINIEATGFHAKPEPIKQLWADDAIRAKRIIVGLMTANREKIDLTKIPTRELRRKLEEIGRSHENSSV